MKKLSLIALLVLVGCTDGQMGKLQALGGQAHVKCWSGDTLIYEGHSTGKVSNAGHSDGYYFVDKQDNKLKEVSGNCIVTYNSY